MKEFVLCWVWKKKQNNIGFPTFKLPQSTRNILWLTCYNIIFGDFGIWLLGYGI